MGKLQPFSMFDSLLNNGLQGSKVDMKIQLEKADREKPG